MPGVTKYNFDLEAARQTLAQNPLHIDRALNEGFRAHTQEIELPGFGDAKRSMFEFFQNELFTADNLQSFRTAIESDSLGLSRASAESLQKSSLVKKKTSNGKEDLDSILEHIDLAIRQTIIDKFCQPINKIINKNKDRVYEAIKAFIDYTPPNIASKEAKLEDIIKTCKEQAREGFINMASTFLGLIRIMPRVLERSGERLSEQDFVKAIHNLKNLLKRYASIHVLKLRIFRNHVGFDAESERLTRIQNGKGTTRFPVDPSKIDQTPDLYHFHQDLFDFIETPEGKQLVNNEKLLEGYREIIEENKIRGKEIDSQDKATIQEIMRQMFTTPTLGCPLGRVKFSDQKNFIEIAFNWMESLINKYYLPVARSQGLFKN